MTKTVTAADANRKFSSLLQNVKKGESFVITSHGAPIATISPAVAESTTAQAARRALLSRLRRQRSANAGRWTRDELYEDSE